MNLAKHLIAVIVAFLSLTAGATSRDINPYDILGVHASSSPDEIKSAYRALARRYHPDLNPGNKEFEDRMKEINAAWAILSDPGLRAMYDQGIRDFKSSRYDRSISIRDEIGNKYSNNKWRYEPSSGKFYDNRIKRWLTFNMIFNSFYSAEGWLFYPQSGAYRSVDIGADFNPDDGKGWHRATSNFSDNYIRIDPNTGFALSAKYEPRTVSDASHLFDELFNPMSVMNHAAKRSDRLQLLKQLDALSWTAEQKADYAERFRVHLKIMKHPDMKVNFTTDISYRVAFMKALLDNAFTLDKPALVKEFIRQLPQDQHYFVEELVLTDHWFNHPNSAQWLAELFAHDGGAKTFIGTVLSGRNDFAAAVARLERVFPLMIRVGLQPEALGTLVNGLAYRGPGGLDAFRGRLLALAKTAEFRDLVARVDPKYDEGLTKFLNWYEQIEPEAGRVFKTALSMPGTRRDAYWIINADHTEYQFHEQEYLAAKERTSRARLEFLDQNLAKPEPMSSLDARTCEDLLSGKPPT